MLVYHSRLVGTPILSVQASAIVANVTGAIVDPDGFKIIAFTVNSPLINGHSNLLDVRSIREYSNYGFVIDDIDELIGRDDVIRISEVLKLNFNPLTLKVETKKGSKLGRVQDFTVTSEDFIIQQIIVKRPTVKALLDPELTISRNEIIEITDYKIIVKDEEKTLKKKAAKEDFIPNFVNPFRTDPTFATSDTENHQD